MTSQNKDSPAGGEVCAFLITATKAATVTTIIISITKLSFGNNSIK